MSHPYVKILRARLPVWGSSECVAIVDEKYAIEVLRIFTESDSDHEYWIKPFTDINGEPDGFFSRREA